MQLRLIGVSKLPIGVRVWLFVYVLALRWIGDLSRVYPAFAPLPAGISDPESCKDSGSHCSDLDSSDSSLDRKKKRKFQKESDSDSESDSSDSFVEKKKRKLRKKKKRKKAKKEKKSKKEGTHHYRQRVSEPSEVVRRYKTVLGIFQKGKTTAEAFNKFGADRNTISQTSELAELAIAAPEKYAQLVQQVKGSKLSDIAKQCKEAVEADKATSETIKQMKENKELLPIRKH